MIMRSKIFFECLLPESFIVTTDGKEETVFFATKRYDRKFIKKDKMLNNIPVPRRLHQEDFAQALCIAASNYFYLFSNSSTYC